MKRTLMNLKKFVELQPEFTEKNNVLEYIQQMILELIEIYTTEFELPDGTKRCLNFVQIDELLGLKKEAQKQ